MAKPLTAQDKTIWFARDPENEIDARWFTTEAEAYQHFCDFGDCCLYTAMNEVEGWSIPLNDEFAERQATDAGLARSLARHERSYAGRTL